MQYQGFVGSATFNPVDAVFHGKLESITNLVTFETTHIEALGKAFEEAAEDYVELCKELK